jgi:hypothetical protein
MDPLKQVLRRSELEHRLCEFLLSWPVFHDLSFSLAQIELGTALFTHHNYEPRVIAAFEQGYTWSSSSCFRTLRFTNTLV